MNAQAQRDAVCCELVHEVASGGGEVRLRVSGASMLPAVWPGDMVTVRQCAFADLRPGELAVFRQEEKLIIHRVERVQGDRLITRGDARPRLDEPVSAGEVVGRVESIRRGGRTVDPKQSVGQRAAAWIFCRSRFCTRATLYVSRRLGRGWPMGAGEMETPLLPKQ